MENAKCLSVRKGYLTALAIAVIVGAVQFSATNFSSKNLQTAVIPTGYTDAIWIMETFPISTTPANAVSTITHADTGDKLEITYNITDQTGGSLTNDDCGGLVLYYGKSYKSDPTTMRPVTATAGAYGSGCIATANLTDNSGNPLKLALGDKEVMFTGYMGSTLYTQYAKKSSPITQWSGQAPTVEVMVTSTYGQCDYNKYWDATTNTCISQPSCGSGWWDTAANSCKYNTCTTDTWGLNKPECSSTATNYSDCRDPWYWYNKTSGVFEKCSQDVTVKADFCNNTTQHTQCETVKADRVTLLEKAFIIDPSVKTTWLTSSYPSFWWEPAWDSTAPYKKYDPAKDALVDCSNNTTTTWTSGVYYANCQPVPTKWSDWYLIKWRGDYAEWKKWNSASTCDNDKVCESSETVATCPADCGVSTTACDNDKICDPGETVAMCPSDCGSSTTICDNDKICDPGETVAMCPSDCGVSTTACDFDNVCDPGETVAMCPSDCGSTAISCDYDKACENGESPTSCSDCSSVTVPPPMPMPYPMPTPSKCSTTDTNCINEGEIGSIDGWCWSGLSCYNKEKTKKYCKSWSYGMGASPTTCSGDFPNQCSPTDTNCIEQGQYGPETGWCMSAMECFVDGKKFCQPWTNDPYKPTACPAGSKLCPSNDYLCIEPNTAGKINGWCKNGMECFNTAGTEKYCLPWGVGPNSSATCPATHPKACSPNDTNCIEIGATGPSSGWCAQGGKQCYVSGGVKCALWEESCPTGSSVCRPDDMGCVEPGTKVPLDTNNYYNKWCGGNSVSCYSKTEMECVAVTGHDPNAWEKAACSKGFGRCRADDKYCLELGETGPSGSWCSSGMSKWNTDGTVTCTSSTDGTIKPPEVEVCMMVLTPGYDADTSKCKVFADSCLPEGWSTLPEGKICVDGKLDDLDKQTDLTTLTNIYNDYSSYLSNLEMQIRDLASNPDAASIESLIDEGFRNLEIIKKLLNSGRKSDIDAIRKGLDEFQKNIKEKIDAKMSNGIQVYIEYDILKDDVWKLIRNATTELSRLEEGTEYYEDLVDGIDQLKTLLEYTENQKNDPKLLRQLMEGVSNAKKNLEVLVQSNRTEQKNSFISDSIADFVAVLARMRAFVSENESFGNLDRRITFALDRFGEKIDELQTVYASGDEKQVLKLIESLNILRDQLVKRLASSGFNYNQTVDLDRIFSHIDELISEKVNRMMENLTNKLAVLSDTIQNIMVRVAEMVDVVTNFSKEFETRMTTVIDNLNYVADDRLAEELTGNKNKMVEKINVIEQEASDLPEFTKEALDKAMENTLAMTHCGKYAESTLAALNSVGLAIEAGNFDNEDLRNFENVLPTEEENHRECRDEGVASFDDVYMTTWYFGSAEYNRQCKLVEGYRNAEGNLIGQFGPADPTTREQALKMFMELLSLPQGSSAVLVKEVPAVSPWAIGYINGAVNAGVDFDWNLKMNEPITRAEAIRLLTEMLIDQNYVQLANKVDAVTHYKDYSQFDDDQGFAAAAETMNDLGIFKGSSDGNLYPQSQLLRSEFSTVNKRVIENLGIKVECE